MGSENCACSGHGPRGCINLALEASPFCYTCSVLARCASPSPLEVATKALEEIAAQSIAVEKSEFDRERWDHRYWFVCGCCQWGWTARLDKDRGKCSNPNCPSVIASRALATIRGTARPAETTKEAPDV